MFRQSMRFAVSMAMGGAEVAAGTMQVLGGDDVVEFRPRDLRHLLLTFEHSIQGKIPEILGDDEEMQVDTLTRLLRGTSEQDVIKLLTGLQVAMGRLSAEREARERRAVQPTRPRSESERRRQRQHAR